MLNHTGRPVIVAVSGNPDPRSGETRLLARAPGLAPGTVAVDLDVDLGTVPPFTASGDRPPSAVASVRDELAGADGLLIASPPVDGGVAEPVDRLLQWLSGTAVLDGTPTAALNTALTADAHLAHAALIDALSGLGAVIVSRACLAVPGTAGAFDAAGRLVDPFVVGVLRVSLAYLADAVLRGRSG
ncbi:MAG TPA: NAD(P)H-dependent oxidoreductase [Acidimicrobiales bacterium]|nr:NAD(P)H-dependent oxidoreductase [Acidimicrobiales bacterium]